MKTTFLFSLISIFTFFLLSTSFAQDKLNEDPNNIRNNNSGTVKNIDGTTAINDKIEFKNETGNAIITITDEGSNKGSITLPEMTSAPSTPTNKLYNENGTLKFNGNGVSGATQINDLLDAQYYGNNLALGSGSNIYSSSGTINTVIGIQSLVINTSGSFNTATGYQALNSNRDGKYNTANGHQALLRNSAGIRNTAVGYLSLYNNIDGNNNTAVGFQALYSA